MFTYSQSTGLLKGANISAVAYSGRGAGLNNPAMQNVHDVGPLPQGIYTISPPHADPKVGPVAMRLTPSPENEMFGRGEFLIHGDNAAQNYSASEGCVVAPHAARVSIGESVVAGDDQLTVTA